MAQAPHTNVTTDAARRTDETQFAASGFVGGEAATLIGSPEWLCRVCRAPLVAEGVEGVDSGLALCPVCQEINSVFPASGSSSSSKFATASGVRRGSVNSSAVLPWAWMSLGLGLASLVVFPAGYAAIVFGWIALRKIARSGGKLAGRGFAQGGIALGAVLGFGAPLMLASIMSTAIKTQSATINSSDPEVVRAVASRFGGLPPPDWLKPEYAHESPYQGSRRFAFVDSFDRPRVHFAGHEMLKIFGRIVIEQAVAENRLGINWPQQTEWSRDVTWGDGERTFLVKCRGASGEDGAAMRHYSTIVTFPNTILGLALITPETPIPGNPQSHALSEEEVRQLFESYVMPRMKKKRPTAQLTESPSTPKPGDNIKSDPE
jgi:hypothetical protein